MQETLTEKSYFYITNEDSLRICLMDLENYKKNHFPNRRMKLGFDTETYWSDDYFREREAERVRTAVPRSIRFGPGEDDWEGFVRLWSIGLDPSIANRQYLIDVKAIGKKVVTKYFKKIFEVDSILIGQNLAYDMGYVALQFNIFPNELRDTMLIAQLRWAGDKLLKDNTEFKFKLSALYKRLIPEAVFVSLTGMTPDEYEDFKNKHQTQDWSVDVLDESDLIYASDDVRLIFYVYDALIKECNSFVKRYPKSGLINQIRVECEFLLEAAIAECVGIAFDSDNHKNKTIPKLEKFTKDAVDKLKVIPEMWIIVRGKEIKAPKKGPYMTWDYIFADPGKGAKLGRALAENLGFDLPKTEKSGEYSVAGDILNELYWESEASRERDILELVIQARTAQSYLDKYGENLLKYVHDDGRLHPNFHQLAAETGRMSATNPALQTIPNETKEELFDGAGITDAELFRTSFIAIPDIVNQQEHEIVDGDFSNEEVRVITVQSGDKVLTRAFRNDEDLHQKTADNLGVKRQDGKAFFLASQYGAFPNKIRRTLYENSRGKFKKSIEEVTELRVKHFQLYHGLADHIEKCAKQIEREFESYSSLCDMAGRKPIIRFTPQYKIHRLFCLSRELELKAHAILRNPNAEDYLHRDYEALNPKTKKWSKFSNEYHKFMREIIRKAFNFDVQGECSVVIKKAATRVGREFRSKGLDPYDAAIILFIHDELLGSIKKDLVPVCKEIMERNMKEVEDEVLKGVVPSKIEIKVGKNWYETH